jgi:hypothetical protein
VQKAFVTAAAPACPLLLLKCGLSFIFVMVVYQNNNNETKQIMNEDSNNFNLLAAPPLTSNLIKLSSLFVLNSPNLANLTTIDHEDSF